MTRGANRLDVQAFLAQGRERCVVWWHANRLVAFGRFLPYLAIPVEGIPVIATCGSSPAQALDGIGVIVGHVGDVKFHNLPVSVSPKDFSHNANIREWAA